LTVLERSKAMGIGPTWSALVQVTTRVALDYAGAGRVERSRATDAASSEAIGTPAEPLGLLSRDGRQCVMAWQAKQ